MPIILWSILLIGALVLPGCATAIAPNRPIPVEIWRVGDDGLTVRFADALEAAFQEASMFRLSTNQAQGTLVVKIPRNVSWTRTGGSTHVNYVVDFVKDNQEVGKSAGACAEDRLRDCAARVLKDAEATVGITVGDYGGDYGDGLR